jgi:endonuclease I
MTKWQAIAACCISAVSLLSLEAAAPSDYYASAEGKSGRALRAALHDRIKDHRVIRYDSTVSHDTVDAVKLLDEDRADTNNVILIYSGWSVPKTDYGSDPDGWNREHIWPDSYGFDGKESWPPMCDLFNLRPCDGRINSSRGNKYFDFSNPADRYYRASAHTNAPLCSTDTDSWEPPDSMRGDIARAMFYMDVRYAGEHADEPDLTLTENVNSIASGGTFMGRLSTLLLWNRRDPVDAAEERRNDLIYEQYQQNRNPFVDHSEWADLVFLPRLLIARDSDGLRIAWEEEWTNAVLEGTVTLPAAAWTLVTNAPTVVEGQRVIYVPTTNASSFYRLRPL